MWCYFGNTAWGRMDAVWPALSGNFPIISCNTKKNLTRVCSSPENTSGIMILRIIRPIPKPMALKIFIVENLEGRLNDSGATLRNRSCKELRIPRRELRFACILRGEAPAERCY